MADDEPLTPAKDDDVIASIIYGLRFSRGKHTGQADELAARTAAARVLDHLRGNFVILRKPASRSALKD